MRSAADEFGDVKTATDSFSSVCRINRNKNAWTIRLFLDSGAVHPLTVTKGGSVKWQGKSLRLYSIVTENRVKPWKSTDQKTYIWGKLRVDLTSQAAYYSRNLIITSATEFKLLSYLCQNEDKLLSKQELLKEVWGRRALNTRTVDMYISRLKRKLTAASCPSDVIRTLHSRGYLFSPANMSE